MVMIAEFWICGVACCIAPRLLFNIPGHGFVQIHARLVGYGRYDPQHVGQFIGQFRPRRAFVGILFPAGKNDS